MYRRCLILMMACWLTACGGTEGTADGGDVVPDAPPQAERTLLFVVHDCHHNTTPIDQRYAGLIGWFNVAREKRVNVSAQISSGMARYIVGDVCTTGDETSACRPIDESKASCLEEVRSYEQAHLSLHRHTHDFLGEAVVGCPNLTGLPIDEHEARIVQIGARHGGWLSGMETDRRGRLYQEWAATSLGIWGSQEKGSEEIPDSENDPLYVDMWKMAARGNYRICNPHDPSTCEVRPYVTGFLVVTPLRESSAHRTAMCGTGTWTYSGIAHTIEFADHEAPVRELLDAAADCGLASVSMATLPLSML